MKTTPQTPSATSGGTSTSSDIFPIMAVADEQFSAGDLDVNAVQKARQFAEPLLSGEVLMSGEGVLEHADAVAEILASIGGSTAMQAAT